MSKRTGRRIPWRCVRRKLDKPDGECECWLFQGESHTAVIDRYNEHHFTCGVCPHIPKASLQDVVQATWYAPETDRLGHSTDPTIGHGRTRSFEEARQAVQCWIAGERKPVKSAPQPDIEEEEITFG